MMQKNKPNEKTKQVIKNLQVIFFRKIPKYPTKIKKK